MNMHVRAHETGDIQKADDWQRQHNRKGSNRLLMLLRQHHFDQAPQSFKRRCVPAIVRPDPLRALVMQHRRAAMAAAVAPKSVSPPVVRRTDAQTDIPQTPALTAIRKTVAAYFGLSIIDLISKRRTKDLVVPRHIAIWLAKTLTRNSYPQIARFFGLMDHSSALFAVRKIEALRARDAVVQRDIEIICRQLEGQ